MAPAVTTGTTGCMAPHPSPTDERLCATQRVKRMVVKGLTGNGDLSDRECDQLLSLWRQPLVQMLSSAVAEELGQCPAGVFGDLAEQRRSDIAAFVHGNRGAATGVAPTLRPAG
jgi:hypothetical protein